MPHIVLDGGGTIYRVSHALAPAFSLSRDAELWRNLEDKRFKEIIIIMEDEKEGG